MNSVSNFWSKAQTPSWFYLAHFLASLFIMKINIYIDEAESLKDYQLAQKWEHAEFKSISLIPYVFC